MIFLLRLYTNWFFSSHENFPTIVRSPETFNIIIKFLYYTIFIITYSTFNYFIFVYSCFPLIGISLFFLSTTFWIFKAIGYFTFYSSIYKEPSYTDSINEKS